MLDAFPRFLARLAVAFLVALAPGCAPVRGLSDAPRDEVHLVVLHTNDVHGRALPSETAEGPRGGLVALAATIERERARARAVGAEVLQLDAGDWWSGTPEGARGGGAPFVSLLSALGYDAMAIGNHELDRGADELAWLCARARPPAVLSNVRDPTRGGARVGWAPPWRIVERAGLRIAVVGLVTCSTPRLSHADASELSFEDPVRALGRVLEELEDEAVDLVVPLTHLGVDEDARLARAFPELPLVVGGHSHTFLERGLAVGKTLVVQAGHGSRALGRVDLWIDRRTGEVRVGRAALVAVRADDPGSETSAAVRAAAQGVAALAGRGEAWERPVGRLEAALERSREVRSSSAGNLVADLLREAGGCELALLNKGGLRRDLPAGPVSRRALFELFPFDDTVVVVELGGDALEALLRRALDGRRYLDLEVAGMELELGRQGRSLRLARCLVGGAALEPDRRYRLATTSFVLGGEDALLPDGMAGEAFDTGLLLREALVRAFLERETLSVPSEERIRLVGEAERGDGDAPGSPPRSRRGARRSSQPLNGWAEILHDSDECCPASSWQDAPTTIPADGIRRCRNAARADQGGAQSRAG